MSRRIRFAAVFVALAISLSACSEKIVPITGTPTAEQVLSNARRVARDLDSYRSTVTVVETTHYPGTPSRDISASEVHNVDVASEKVFRMNFSWGLEVVHIKGWLYSRSKSEPWAIKHLASEEGLLFPGDHNEMEPAGHPARWLDRHQMANTRFSGRLEEDGRSLYLVEGSVPMLPGSPAVHPSVPADDVRMYVDTQTFEIVRVEVDRNIRDSEREDVGYQVIPGVVEIKTREIFEYSKYNVEVRIEPPVARPAA